MKPIAQVNDLRQSSDVMIGMMKDLDLIIRILDTMQEREYLSDKQKVEERERALLWERGSIAKEVLDQWIKHGTVKRYEEVALRFGLMLSIPADRFVATVDDLAHVYERRYKELTHMAVTKQAERQSRSRNELNAMFTKKAFPFAGAMS